jgi:hypothetical protein
MTRLLCVLSGLVLVAIAFVAGTMVADTREGLIAEIVTLLAGLSGVGLLLFGLVPKRRRPAGAEPVARASASQPPARRTANDLLLGSAGIAVALLLLGGLVLSGGWLWAALGAVLLVPMIAGSAYLLISFARAPERDWSISLARLFRSRSGG